MNKTDVCPICNRIGKLCYTDVHDVLASFDKSFSFFKCSKCRLLWSGYFLKIDDIPFYYPEAYYTHESIEELQQSIFYPNFGYIYNLLEYTKICDTCTTKVLLDIGCGNGHLLVSMKRKGWNAFGIDIDRVAIGVARKHGLKNLVVGNLDQCCFRCEFFDFIIVHHVIEHIRDPVSFIHTAYRLLKPNGYLMIVTPNLQGLGMLTFGRNCLHLDAVRHRVLLSPTSIRILMRKSLFKFIRATTICRMSRLTAFASLQILFEKKIDLKSKNIFWMLIASFFELFETILMQFSKNYGEEIVAIYKK